MMCMGPFRFQFVGLRVLYERNNCPRTRLRALGVYIYDPSLCMWSINSLLWYPIFNFGWVAL